MSTTPPPLDAEGPPPLSPGSSDGFRGRGDSASTIESREHPGPRTGSMDTPVEVEDEMVVPPPLATATPQDTPCAEATEPKATARAVPAPLGEGKMEEEWCAETCTFRSKTLDAALEKDAGTPPAREAGLSSEMVRHSVEPLCKRVSEPAIKSREQQRVGLFQDEVAPDTINIDKVRALAFQGIPDSKVLRSVYWKLLLGYLPPDRSAWDAVLNDKRSLYRNFCEEMYRDRTQDKSDNELAGDHPLRAESREWTGYFEDQETMEEIEKDIRRTLPDLHFFNSSADDGGMTKHYEALRRILFVFAKLNPGIRYVQGMNEILAVLYYVFANDPNDEDSHAEEDAFGCFSTIMSEIRDLFISASDKCESGVKGWLQKLDERIEKYDHEVWLHLTTLQIIPQFYALRWLTLLLSQEFDLPDVMRLWDALFSDAHRFDFIFDVCVAMIMSQRHTLLAGEFADCMKLLQHFPPTDVNVLLAKAERLPTEVEEEHSTTAKKGLISSVTSRLARMKS